MSPTNHKKIVSNTTIQALIQTQQNWSVFLRLCVTHFKCWFLVKFSDLTTRPNKSWTAREIFFIWMRGNDIFFPIKQENNGKIIFRWAVLKRLINQGKSFICAEIKKYQDCLIRCVIISGLLSRDKPKSLLVFKIVQKFSW